MKRALEDAGFEDVEFCIDSALAETAVEIAMERHSGSVKEETSIMG